VKNKALIVAIAEFTTLVRSKAFIVGLLMMPAFAGVAIGVQRFTKDATDVKDRRFAVVDRTGVLYAPLVQFIEPTGFALGLSLNLLLMVIVGGAGFFFGPFLGAAVSVLLPEWLRFSEGLYLILYAIAVIIYIAVAIRNRVAGVDMSLLYHELPPD